MQTDFRKTKPAPKSDIDFTLPVATKFKLNNGITVQYIHKTDLPVIKLNVLVNSGSKLDPAGKKGLTYLTSMLIDEGAGSYGALELDAEFEKLGTAVAILTSQDYVNITSLALEENFEESLKLISAIILEPHFSEENYNIEKMKLGNKLKRKFDDPDYVATNTFEKILFAGNRYAYPAMGLHKDVETISLNDLKAYYNVTFIKENVDIIAAGSLEPGKLQQMLNTYLGKIKSGNESGKSEFYENKLSRKVIFVKKKGSAQSEIRIGNIAGRRTDEFYYSRLLLNSILGGQFSSRLNHNLREDKGYTYGIHSSFNYYKNAGYFEISTSVQSEVTIPAINEIMYEVDGIFKGVTKDELDFCKSFLVRRYPSLFETYSQLVNNLTSLNLHGLDDKYFNEYIESIRNVTMEQVLDAREWIKPEEFQIVIVGDDKLEEEIKVALGDDIDVLNFTEVL